jgi:drug/metabolite transporter (DMT)-like permease
MGGFVAPTDQGWPLPTAFISSLAMVDSVATGGGRPAGVWQNAYILLTIVALLWAGNAIVGRAARDLVPPFTLALVRWGGALILLLPFAWRRLIEEAATLRRCWWQTLLLGLLGVGAFNAFLYSYVDGLLPARTFRRLI